MHYEYLRTMMDYYVRNSDNYMFPQLENVHSTISFVGRNTIVATPLTDTDLNSHFKVLLSKSFKGQANYMSKCCTKYVMFHGKTMERIPYDSEIDHFLHRWLAVEIRNFNNIADYDSLCMKIHDSCALVYFGVKMIRKNNPRTKNNWSKKLTSDEKEVFNDYSLTLHNTPKPVPKRNTPEQFNCSSDLNTRPYKKFRSNNNLCKNTKVLKQFESLDSQKKSSIVHVEDPMALISEETTNLRNRDDKNDNSATNDSCSNTDATAKATNSSTVGGTCIQTSWVTRYECLKKVWRYEVNTDLLPENWANGTDIGSHPRSCDILKVVTDVTKRLTKYIHKLEDDNLEDLALQAEYDGDDFEAAEIREEIGNLSAQETKCTIQIMVGSAVRYLKMFVKHNVVWDLGFQMLH